MNFYTNKQVLITGGAGFIGSHLTQELVNLGARVTVYDDLSTGKKENIASVRHAIRFVEGDIRDMATCLKTFKNCDIIFHLAAFISVPQPVEHPYACHDINVNGTSTVLEAARFNQIKHVVFSSSCAVYGNQETAVNEQTPCNPESPYAYSKWMGELYCQQYSKYLGLKSTSLRYFNVIGERQNPYGPYAGVYAKFNEAMQKNEPIIIYGDGTQSRDFIPVNEVVQANLLFGTSLPEFSHGQPINIATGQSQSVLNLYEQLTLMHNYKRKPLFLPERPGDLKHSSADCSLYKKIQSLRKQP